MAGTVARSRFAATARDEPIVPRSRRESDSARCQSQWLIQCPKEALTRRDQRHRQCLLFESVVSRERLEGRRRRSGGAGITRYAAAEVPQSETSVRRGQTQAANSEQKSGAAQCGGMGDAPRTTLPEEGGCRVQAKGGRKCLVNPQGGRMRGQVLTGRDQRHRRRIVYLVASRECLEGRAQRAGMSNASHATPPQGRGRSCAGEGHPRTPTGRRREGVRVGQPAAKGRDGAA